MGSSKEHKKHKEKKKHKKRSRSKSRERDYKKHSHRHRDKEREREKDRFEKDDLEKERYERDREREKEKKRERNDREKDRERIKEKSHKRPLEEPENERQSKRIKEDTEVKHERHIKKEQSPDGARAAATSDGQSHESLSIEDTNKLRAKLGLAPLKMDSNEGEEGGETAGSQEPEEVFVPTPNMGKEAWLQKMREKVAQQRQKRRITERLKQVVPLAEQVRNEESATDWVLRSRQIQKEKEEAEKRAKLLEDLDQEFGVDQLVSAEFSKAKPHKVYTSKDLKHLTIGHAQTVFQEGRDVILTLKDQEVLADADDVLENVNILDNLKAAQNIENKKCRPGYVPYEEPEFDEFGILKKKAVLSKYDEEIGGKKPETFKLGDSVAQEELEMQMVQARLKQQAGKMLVMLQAPKLQPLAEYYTSEEMVQFKKIKKKRKVRRRGLKPEEIMPLPGEEGKVDHGSRNKPEPMETAQQDDEDEGPVIVSPVTAAELGEEEEEQVLSKVRRRLQQGAGVREAAKVMWETLEQLPEEPDKKEEPGISIVLNSTKEFCRKLGDIPTYGLSGNRDQEEIVVSEPMEEDEAPPSSPEPQHRGAWNEVDPEAGPSLLQSTGGLQPILEEEPDLSRGLAGALKLATKKGYLEKESDKHTGASRLSHIQAKSYTIEEKFYEDDKFGSKRGERYCGPVSEFREKDTYKPDVKLEYIDDSGRKLTAKEAFRYLSHKFHGKGPGKNKVDKRMKKLEQDAKLKQMSSTDTPLSTVKLLQEKQKELQAPFILLSGGGSKALAQSSAISKSK